MPSTLLQPIAVALSPDSYVIRFSPERARYGWPSISAGLALLLIALTAQAQITPIEIASLEAPVPSTQVYDINDHGQVVGVSATATWGHAISWTVDDGIVDLGSPCGAYSIAEFVTNSGTVIGRYVCFGSTNIFHAFYWTESQGLVDIAPLYDVESRVFDFDAKSGQAVGNGCSSSSCGAFSWTLDGGIVEMNPGTACQPNDLNRVGQATGTCGNSTAFIWSEAAGMEFLEPLMPSDACYGEALNDLGQVVGTCVPGSGNRFGFSWTAAGGMIKIELEGSNHLAATFVNNSGQVGGNTSFGTTQKTFSAWAWTQDGGTVRIDPGDFDASSLLGLTEEGQYVGVITEQNPSTGVQYAFVWTEQDGIFPLLLENTDTSYPIDWNDKGQIAGQITVNTRRYGFLWTPSAGMVLLASPPDASQKVFVDAVNNRGQVAGTSNFASPTRNRSALWNTQPPPFSAVMGLSDLNDNESPDVALVREDADGHFRAHVYDGATGQLIRRIDFGTRPISAAVVVERSTGTPDIAVMQKLANGSIRVLVKNAASGAQIANLQYGTAYSGIDLAAADIDGDGSPEVGVLGEGATQKSRILYKNVDSGAVVAKLFQSVTSESKQLLTVPTINGGSDAEAAVRGEVRATGSTRVRVQDTGTSSMLQNMQYGALYVSVEAAVIPDAGGPGQPGIADMGARSDTGKIRIRSKDATTGAVLTTSFIPATQTAVDLAAVSHVTATGPIKTDMAALLESSGGKGSVWILDASTGALLSTVAMIPLDAPRALAVSADINGNGADELVGLGERNGVDRIAIFDSQTGLKIRVISVP